MRDSMRNLAKAGWGAGLVGLALAAGVAQTPPHKPAADSPAATRTLMVQKAHLLEARGRADLAVQVWQQILLSDPRNADALAGLARDGQPAAPAKPVEKPSQPAKASQPVAKPANAGPARDAQVKPQSASATHAAATPAHAASAKPPAVETHAAHEPAHTPAPPATPPAQAQLKAEQPKPPAPKQAEPRPTEKATVSPHVSAEQAQFSSLMADAATAAGANHPDAAVALYQQALSLRPHAAEALKGLAAQLIKQQQFAAAAPFYEELVKSEPASREAWRGLFLCDARGVGNQQALDAVAHMPAAVKAALAHDPEYLHTLAAVYQAADRPDDAQRVLAQAVKLPAQENAGPLQTETKFEFASMLMDEKRYDQAAALYTQLVGDESASLPAWLGLVNAHHLMGRDDLALADVKQMPSEQYNAALKNVGFLATMAAVDEQTGQLEAAQGLLERAAALESVAGRHPTVGLELQLAGVELARGDAANAVEIFRQSSVAAPERAEAWRGLVFSLAALRHDEEAVRQIALIPEQVRRTLEGDIGFVETEASLYAATGDAPQALESMSRVKAYFSGQHADIPAYLAVQYAQLLFNGQEDRQLYSELTHLGARTDLTAEQKATVRTIWSDWSVRRADEAAANGNSNRAADILAAALLAFPENITLRKATAESLVRAGRGKEALALYKSIPMDNAPAAAVETAVSLCLAANDKAQAAQWLRQSLPRFPRDATLLALAGRYEQSIGESDRAADYFRAALAISPTISPATLPLAGPAPEPASAQKPASARPTVTAADLPRLLDPANDFAAGVQTTAGLPAPGLPASAAAASPPSGKTTQVWPPVDAAQSHSNAPNVGGNAADSAAPAHQMPDAGDGSGADVPTSHVFPPSASQGVSPAPVFVPPAQ